jgi:HlyD family secretion protein
MSATEPSSEEKAANPGPGGTAAKPTPEAAAAEPKPQAKPAAPEAKAAGPSPEAKAAEPAKHDAEANESKPEPKAAKPTADPKALELAKPDAKAAEPKPNAKGAEPQKTDASAAKPKFEARNKIVFSLSILGVLAALVAAYLFGRERKTQPPVFPPASSPYESAIYANGIIESDQSSGSNINIYPEVSGPITNVFVHEGQEVSAGTPLLTIDESIQKATTEQLRLQSEAALALLYELKEEPRAETLAIAEAQVGLAESNLKAASDQYDKDRASYDIDPKSISKDVLDTANDAVKQADSALDVARKQYELTKAGAWSYDIANQEKQYVALQQAYEAANALLVKFSIKAPIDGVVLSVYAAVGSYVSSQGAFDPYTQAFDQVVIMGPPQEYMAVRAYVDEILISRLPSKWHIRAQMSITGSNVKVPLEFVRVQPYVSPKIELSDERQERVDLRVLPVIFRFQKQDLAVYPGQLVDVYIGQQ